MDPGGPANALGASRGRGLSSLTNGGRFGNDSVKHAVTTQGFGATVNIEDLVTSNIWMPEMESLGDFRSKTLCPTCSIGWSTAVTRLLATLQCESI